jgi:NitT/TauT family transport system ATP-binding protein
MATEAAALPFARLRQLEKRFTNGTQALRSVDLTIEQGTFLSLLGPSGCGKSTVLRMLAGLAAPSGGSIEFPAEGLRARSDRNDRIGYVFQDPTLMPWCSILKNVALPLRISGAAREESFGAARLALASVGLRDCAHLYPHQLSGGMKMRASIARAIVTRPKVLLLDEPFAALDELTRQTLNHDLLELWRKQRFTTVFVTHAVTEAVFAARPGRIIGDYSIDIPVQQRTSDLRETSVYQNYLRDITRCLQDGAAS